MCAATSATPTCISAGTIITAAMMYDAVTGTASPSTQTASAGVERSSAAGCFPRASTISPATFRPSPVSVIDADDDAGRRGRGGDRRARRVRRRQARSRAGVGPSAVSRLHEAERDGEHRGPEHRAERREAQDHQHDDRGERREVVPAAVASARQRRQRRRRPAAARAGANRPRPSGRSRGSRAAPGSRPSR